MEKTKSIGKTLFRIAAGVVGGGFMVIVGIGVLAYALGNDAGGTSAPAPAAASVIIVSETCKAMAGIFGSDSDLTDLQKDAAWDKTANGKHFHWRMTVKTIDSSIFGGGYVGQFKCLDSDSRFGSDIILSFESRHKNLVMGFNKGDVVNIHGELKGFMSLTGLSGDFVEVL